MLTAAVLSALGGAAGLGALITPVLVHLTSRRLAVQTENAALIDQLQQERDTVTTRLEQRDATIASLWDYVFRLRYWGTAGAVGEPPGLPEELTTVRVTAR
jgi:hypothetical protein